MRNDSERIEANIPVQARVNVIDLATLTMWWEKEGYQIRSMSQLIGWSMEKMCDVLRANGLIEREFESIAEADRYLDEVRLYQPSLRRRGFKKTGTAIRFENMREEGMDPRTNDKLSETSYKMLHNRRSIEPMPRATRESNLGLYLNEWEKRLAHGEITQDEFREEWRARAKDMRAQGYSEERILKTRSGFAKYCLIDERILDDDYDRFKSLLRKEGDDKPNLREGQFEGRTIDDMEAMQREKDKKILEQMNSDTDDPNFGITK